MKRGKILTRLGHLSGKEAYWAFYLLSLLSIMAPIALMYIHLRGAPCIGETALNAFIVMLPYFFVGRRWRWTALLPVWAVALFFLSNLWYWRFFRDFMPFSSYFLWNNLGGEVIDTTLMLMKPVDAALVLPAILTTALYALFLRKPLKEYRGVSPVWKIASPAVAVAAFCLCYTKELKEFSIRRPACLQVSPWVEYNVNGLVGYVLKETKISLERVFRSREASEADLQTIARFKSLHGPLVLGGGITV